MNRRDFQSAFAPPFATAAVAAGFSRGRSSALNWTRVLPDGYTLSFGLRLNRRNIPDYPGEFVPDIHWSAPPLRPTDPGDVSFFQYTTEAELEAVDSLRRAVIDRFIRERGREHERSDPGTLTGLLAKACEQPILPNHNRWLPYWRPDDARAWGELFGSLLAGWLARFAAAPETLEAWCWRTLWTPSKPSN